MSSLYIFIDESGNFDFSQKGTKHFVMCAITALNPLVSSRALQRLKYKLLTDGIDVSVFHASPDLQVIRDAVLAEIGKLTNIQINYIYANKHKTHPSYQSPDALYALFGKTLLKYVFHGWLAGQFDQVIVIVDKSLTNKQQEAFIKELKPELKVLGKPYKIYFHPTTLDFNSQIADYSAWAMYVSLERNEIRPINDLQHIQITKLDIFRFGRTNYY